LLFCRSERKDPTFAVPWCANCVQSMGPRAFSPPEFHFSAGHWSAQRVNIQSIKTSNRPFISYMAEALAVVGVISSICSLIEFTASLIGTCNTYFCAVKSAQDDVVAIVGQANVLKSILEHLQKLCDQLLDSGGKSHEASSSFLNNLAIHLRECDEAVKALAVELGVKVGQGKDDLKFTRSEKLKWPLKEGRRKMHVTKIEGIMKNIIVILGGITVAQNMTINQNIDGMGCCIADLVTSFQNAVEDAENEKIRAWVKENAPDSSTNHRSARHRCTPGTGDWLLKSHLFQSWLKGDKSAIWLYGIPGVGKTIICSTIIEKVKSICPSGSGARYAYYYFDFN
jgi:hypothetical protein